MIKLNKIQPNNLNFPEITKEIGDSVQECIDFMLVSDANELRRKLEEMMNQAPEIEKSNPSLFNKYNNFVFLLKWMDISALTPEEVGELVKEHLLLAIKYGVEVEKRITSYMILYNDMETGGKLRWKLIELIRENEEKFNDEGLKYIKDWVKNYEGSFDIKKRRETLEQMGYMNRNENVRKLGKDKRDLLLTLIKFYDFLRFKPVKEIFTTTQKARTVKLPAEEEREKLQKKEDLKKQAIEKYKDVVNLEEISKQESYLVDQYGSNFAGLVEAVVSEIKSQDIDKEFIFGALLYLVEKNSFTLLARHGKLREEFLIYLKRIKGENAQSNYELNDLAPSSVKLFLQFILRYKLNMSQSDSAAFGMKLVNAFKKAGKGEYRLIVFFDIKSKSFLWSK